MKSIVSPTTGDEMLFIHARDIDSLKRRELSLQKKAEIDEVTGLYNLGTTKLLITSTLENRKYEKECESAFLLIDIDNFKEVNRIGGFVTGDRKLTYDFIYQNTYHALDTAKRNGGNELVFYSDIKNMASEPIKDEADLSEVFGKALRWIEKGESQREVYRLLMSFLEKITMLRK